MADATYNLNGGFKPTLKRFADVARFVIAWRLAQERSRFEPWAQSTAAFPQDFPGNGVFTGNDR
jgi:hypothetical protein